MGVKRHGGKQAAKMAACRDSNEISLWRNNENSGAAKMAASIGGIIRWRRLRMLKAATTFDIRNIDNIRLLSCLAITTLDTLCYR